MLREHLVAIAASQQLQVSPCWEWEIQQRLSKVMFWQELQRQWPAESGFSVYAGISEPVRMAGPALPFEYADAEELFVDPVALAAAEDEVGAVVEVG